MGKVVDPVLSGSTTAPPPAAYGHRTFSFAARGSPGAGPGPGTLRKLARSSAARRLVFRSYQPT
eukprot:11784267-Karenia_brevis.AAC.1